MHRLLERLTDATGGRFPPADGTVELVGRPPGRGQAVMAFTNHFLVAADVDPAWVARWMPPGDVLAPLAPRTLAALGERLGTATDVVDAVLAAPARTGGAPGGASAPPGGVSAASGGGPARPAGAPVDSAGLTLTEVAPDAHPRVVRALAHRDDVRVLAAPGIVVTLGRGLAGRFEVAFEVDPAARGQGLARRALVQVRALVPAGEPLFAQVSPGNAASLRAVLAAGFVPLGAEALFR